MISTELKLPGAYLIEPERIEDERGFFARTWSGVEFERHGLNPKLVQCNISFNRERGTLRGMHFQASPYEECKLIRCTRGRIFDVIIDLRSDSQTFKQSFGVELNRELRNMLYVPEGFAHGFLTLEDETEIFYQMSQSFEPNAARGVRWNDPVFGIDWPEEVRIMKDRDKNYADFLTD